VRVILRWIVVTEIPPQIAIDRVLRVHGLAEPRGSPLGVARRIVGLHATDPLTPYLSLLGRMERFEGSAFDAAAYDQRTLIKLRCMRVTLFWQPVDIAPEVFAATQPKVRALTRRYLEGRGVEPAEYEALVRQVEGVLAGGESSVTEIRARLDSPADISGVVGMMCDEGRLYRSQPVSTRRDRRVRYGLMSVGYPDLDLGSLDERDGVRRLVRRYVRAYGPVSIDDIAWWSGIGKTPIRWALSDLPVAAVRLAGEDEPMVMLEDDVADLGRPISSTVSVLPLLDPYVMGYKHRHRYLDPRHRPFVFDRSGNATSTILVGGRVAGVWQHDRTSIGYVLFQDEQEELIRARLAGVGRFLTGEDLALERHDSMIPLTEGGSGRFQTPLG
jgi:hypothetical protein